MKNCIVLFSLLILFFVVSCTKNEDDNQVTDAVFLATKNDLAWTSTSSWVNYSKQEKRFIVAGVKLDSKYYQEEELYFDFKTSNLSATNTVTSFHAEWIYIIGGDVITDSYQIDSTYNNSIKITSLDTIHKNIAGTFTIKLLHNKQLSDNGETLLYRNGIFQQTYQVLP